MQSNYMYITPRTLLGIIRIAQALAKLHFRNEVCQKDVDRSIKLMDWSLESLLPAKDKFMKDEFALHQATGDRNSKVFSVVKDLFMSEQQSQIKVADIWKKIRNTKLSGIKLTNEMFIDVLDQYKKLHVLHIDEMSNVVLL